MYFGIKGLSTNHLCLVAEKVNLKILQGQALLAKSAIFSGRKKKLLVLWKNQGQSEFKNSIQDQDWLVIYCIKKWLDESASKQAEAALLM